MKVAVFITRETVCHTLWCHATPLQMLNRRSRNVLYKHNQRKMNSGRKGHLRKLQMEETKVQRQEIGTSKTKWD